MKFTSPLLALTALVAVTALAAPAPTPTPTPAPTPVSIAHLEARGDFASLIQQAGNFFKHLFGARSLGSDIHKRQDLMDTITSFLQAGSDALQTSEPPFKPNHTISGNLTGHGNMSHSLGDALHNFTTALKNETGGHGVDVQSLLETAESLGSEAGFNLGSLVKGKADDISFALNGPATVNGSSVGYALVNVTASGVLFTVNGTTFNLTLTELLLPGGKGTVQL